MSVIHLKTRRRGPVAVGQNLGVEQHLNAYCRFFESLDKHDFDFLRGYFNYRVRYSNPLCDVRGVDRVQAVFERLYRRCEAPQLIICDTAVSGQHGLIYWKFVRHKKRPNSTVVTGMSRVKFDGYGRVVSHRDIWDASHAPRRPLARLRDAWRRWFGARERPKHYRAKPFHGSPPF